MRGAAIAWWRDRDYERLVAAEIHEELQSHLAMVEDELVASGMSRDDARVEALRRFGNVDDVARDCRRIRLREHIIMQRVKTVLLVVLAVALLWVALQARAAEAEHARALAVMETQRAQIQRLLQRQRGAMAPNEKIKEQMWGREEEKPGVGSEPKVPAVEQPQQTEASFVRRLNEAWPLDTAGEVAADIAGQSTAAAMRMFRRVYGQITNAEVRALLIEHMLVRHGQSALQILALGIEDASEEVRAKMLAKLSDYALFDTAADAKALEEWWGKHRDRPAGDVLKDSIADWVRRLGTAEGDGLADLLTRLNRKSWLLARSLSIDLAEQLNAAGIGAVLERAALSPEVEVAKQAWQLVPHIGAGEAFVRRHALPLLARPNEIPTGFRSYVYAAIAAQHKPWATDALVGAMKATLPKSDSSFYDIGIALAKAKDPRAIPDMIAMIVADDSYRTIYGIGYWGLGKLTGVPYDDSHDGAWWLDWWKRNQHRLPASVRGRQIPKVTLRRSR